MQKFTIFLALVFTCSLSDLSAQDTLPRFTLKNTNGQISILWQNKYQQQVKGISVQRSYDSTKNFSSIVTVLNPQNTINGFIDKKPPFAKMYYRLFIVFDTGAYIITTAKRPVLNTTVDYTPLIKEINALYEQNSQLQQGKANGTAKNNGKTTSGKPAKTPAGKPMAAEIVNAVITYPSRRVYTDANKDNNIVINLPYIKKYNYSIKFFNEEYVPLFELKHISDDYMLLEKVNFHQSGWYLFEIYRNDRLLEENKLFIPKDEIKNN